MQLNAIQISVLTALAEMPTKVLSFRFCLLDLPAVLVNGSDRGGAQLQQVGHEHQRFARVLAHCLDPAQQMRAFVVGVTAAQAHELVVNDGMIRRWRLEFLELSVSDSNGRLYPDTILFTR